VIVQASCHGTDNAALLDALRRGEGRYAGVAMIDEATTDAELDELHGAGVRGTRMNFVAHLGVAPTASAVERIVARAAERDWHVVLHLDAADLARYAPLLALLPCSYVIDHMGPDRRHRRVGPGAVPGAAGPAPPGRPVLGEAVGAPSD
jgi:predicted TIM-barrel fold metal-dependent hydrolase